MKVICTACARAGKSFCVAGSFDAVMRDFAEHYRTEHDIPNWTPTFVDDDGFDVSRVPVVGLPKSVN